MRAFKITELSAVDRPAQQGARALFFKREGELPPALARLGADEPVLPGPEATPEEEAAARLHNVLLRDRAEREAAARGATSPPRTLADLDTMLEGMAEAARREGETMERAYARLLHERSPEFAALLRERERVEAEGP